MKDKPVILIVDDQPQDIELLEAHLVPQGYEIVKAASGEEALEKLSSNQIALILMDVLMPPGMDGFEVTRRIRRDTAHRLIPIILITALQETEDRVKGIEAGCDDFLSKPLDKMELFARVRSLLQVKAYNDLMNDYQIELEAMVTSRTEELRHALEDLQQEIAERKRSEQELKEKESLLKGIIDGVSDVLSIQYPDHSIERYNQAGYDLLGMTFEEVQGKKCFELIGRDRECTECATRKALKSGKIEQLEKYVPELGIYFDCRSNPILDEDGNVVRIIEHLRDITEQKRAEEERELLQAQFVQAQKMESVGRLAGGVAHDFNNMLGVILGHAEFALEKADENHDLCADLKEIQTAARRSADLTKQLLTFARKQIIAPKMLDLNDTVESMLSMLRRLIGEDINLSWNPAKGVWPVKMDPSQVDQILANLCVNAKDAIEGVGKLTIETGMKSFDQEYCADHAGFIPGDFVVLAVSDDGCGMDKMTLYNLFEPFFTTKDVGKGTGLGLSTVYGIVKQNNGFINVYSEPDHGTTFRIYLPRCVAADETPAVIPPYKPDPTGNETVLLVEDEPAILRMARMMLERMGYSVLPAATPAEAIDLAKTHADKIDLLMTDVIMPEMNGRDLAKHLTALYPDIKLLFMSGYTTNVISDHGVMDEKVAFIQKPFLMKDLAEKVREVLDTAQDKVQ
ncbi:MAG: response regulator [Desulfotignum sp.]|nr:response regulator [Desulfotignum sp.]